MQYTELTGSGCYTERFLIRSISSRTRRSAASSTAARIDSSPIRASTLADDGVDDGIWHVTGRTELRQLRRVGTAGRRVPLLGRQQRGEGVGKVDGCAPATRRRRGAGGCDSLAGGDSAPATTRRRRALPDAERSGNLSRARDGAQRGDQRAASECRARSQRTADPGSLQIGSQLRVRLGGCRSLGDVGARRSRVRPSGGAAIVSCRRPTAIESRRAVPCFDWRTPRRADRSSPRAIAGRLGRAAGAIVSRSAARHARRAVRQDRCPHSAAAAGEQILDAADDHLRLERLDQHAVAADGARARLVDRLERAGQQQHGNVREARDCP